MNISLSFSDLSKCSIALPNENDDESIDSILIYICSLLGEKLRFQISGFGQDRWPVCSDTDIADVLSQLPNILESTKKFLFFEVVFSEQALSRRLEFYPNGDNSYIVKCLSWGSWVANPVEETIGRQMLFNSFFELFSTFAEGLGEVCPQTLNNYWIQQWIQQIDQNDRSSID
jgi:hypothetical protein